MKMILKYFSEFTEEQQWQFEMLEPLYKEWNEKINVISRKDIDSLYEKHVLHSLSIAAVFDFTDNMEIMDLGTGGGFPGIPLAIFFPNVKFHLVDSIGKKLKVIDAISHEIGLKNISTQHCRAEDIHNRKFDFVVSRAVAQLKELWSWSKPFLNNPKSKISGKPAGMNGSNYSSGLICLKGGDLSNEISEIKLKPRVFEIDAIFPEVFFKDKYILFLQK